MCAQPNGYTLMTCDYNGEETEDYFVDRTAAMAAMHKAARKVGKKLDSAVLVDEAAAPAHRVIAECSVDAFERA